MKGKRQQEILRIIEEQDIDTQDQLMAELRARGLQSTQAVSYTHLDVYKRQVLDMAGEGRALGLTEVEELQRLKTGALIRAAVEMGCAVAGGAEEQREALCRYADCLGLAFQIQDDILDVVGDEATLGKPIGSDARSDKTTFVALKGLADCRILVAELTDRAVEALAPFGSEAESLRGLAQSLAGREK